MESRRTPAILAAMALALAVVLFFALRDGGGDESEPAAGPAATTTERGDGEGDKGEGDTGGGGDTGGRAQGDGGKSSGRAGDGGRRVPPEEPPAAGPVIEIRDGKPVGGVQELSFLAGDRILFEVRSDADAHVHLHGYDVFKDVPAGGAVTYDVPATIEGVFELEIESTATPLAEITVQPG